MIRTYLNGALTATATSATVDDGTIFPITLAFTILIDNEKIRCTTRSTNTLTISRAWEGTTAAAHDDGEDVILLEVDAGAYESAQTTAEVQAVVGRGDASGVASLNSSGKIVEQPASITDHLDNTAGGTDAEVTKAPTSDEYNRHYTTLSGRMYLPFGVYISIAPFTTSSNPYAATVDRTLTFVKWGQAIHVATTNDATNYWTIYLRRLSDAADITTLVTSSMSADTWTLLTTTSFTITSVGTTGMGVYVVCQKTNSPGALYLLGPALEVSA